MLHLVKDNLEEYNHLITTYGKCHSALVDELSTQNSDDVDATIGKESSRVEERQNSTIQFRTTVMNWIAQTESSLTDKMSTCRQNTLSSKSRHSRMADKSRSLLFPLI